MGKVFTVILAFIVVMVLLLLTTRYLAYKSKKMLKGNYMQIIETLNLGTSNRIHLIKVDKEFFIVAASNKNVEFLSQVSINDYQEQEVKNPISEVVDFTSILKKYTNGLTFGVKTTKEKVPEPSQNENESENNVVFRSNLEKLKNLSNSMNNHRSENG
ncbi:flagellar biosynthetic protein FliO [Clostridium sp. BNL1100]|uniref:flagellar biosynthetic protein FliO n=1 Tax=Clostridium sp. BNL1100 TaxID=755731 RepID=UPI00024A795B|nr:flagellar biosynthetic protein FliO [Clostridium sp. BNL1100]AEY66568.1 flagellar biogenesis protein [Clostridium sp. BNL1100]